MQPWMWPHCAHGCLIWGFPLLLLLLQTEWNRFTAHRSVQFSVVHLRVSYAALDVCEEFLMRYISPTLPVTCSTALLDCFPAAFSAVQVYVPAFPREHRVRTRTATPSLKEVLREGAFTPKWPDNNGQTHVFTTVWNLKFRIHLHILTSFLHIITMTFSRWDHQSLTIVLPGNSQRPTSCDNTLKCSIASFADGTVLEWFFEVRWC